ncbi:MAG: hypothetical protein KJ587_08645 [Alphaproteobacteria bacterium]|nr:hypothetical protein [Alphaproteobacteria bacterium]
MKQTLIAATVLVAVTGAAVLPTAAEAKIRCDGPWQIVQGNKISTPYCGDNYLAQVARGYGSNVSARAIRENPSTKREICQWIGHDPKVQDICAGLRNDDGGRGGRN